MQKHCAVLAGLKHTYHLCAAAQIAQTKQKHCAVPKHAEALKHRLLSSNTRITRVLKHTFALTRYHELTQVSQVWKRAHNAVQSESAEAFQEVRAKMKCVVPQPARTQGDGLV
jgi:hypothetical protein